MTKIDFAKELNEQQLKVVRHGDGPCLVLAGAGSGKTRAITYRVAYLLEQGVKPENILLLTFTNKAAREMLERARALSGASGAGIIGLWSGTFHSIANRILRQHAPLLGFQPNFSILDEDDSETLIKSCLKDLNYDSKNKRFPSAKLIKSLWSFALNSQTPLLEVMEIKVPHFTPAHEDARVIIARYQKRKQEANAMDFDDLLIKWLELLENQPAVLKKLSGQFKYILVDEYQDTNKIQAAIVGLLAGENQNLLVVGDDAQSIYSFRAADINNILDFNKTWPKAQVFRLEINYRSTPEILKLANHVISQNSKQFTKNLTSLKRADLKPEIVKINTPADEAEFIVKRILELRSAGHELSHIAVLFRAAFHAQWLEMELNRRGLPYDFRGGMRFFERAHIKDTLSFLRLVNNHRDCLAWLRVLENFQGIGHETAKVIINKAQASENLEQVLAHDLTGEINAKAQRGWADARSLFGDLLKAAVNGPSAAIEAVANSVFADYLKNEYENADDRLDDIRQLANFAKYQKTLNHFLTEITLDDKYSETKKDQRDRLVLSTIHQAKGLEWEAVFVINLANGAFPNERALAEDGGEEEERRLFYVAVTRAKNRLYLTTPAMSADFSYNQPSIFLAEIRRDLIEQKDKVDFGNGWGKVTADTGDGDFKDDVPTVSLAATADIKKQVRPKEFLKRVEEL